MKSYKEYKDSLKEIGINVPDDVKKFPMGMKSWKRKLRYERSKDYSFGEHPRPHDERQKRYYKGLERLGHPNPENIIARHP